MSWFRCCTIAVLAAVLLSIQPSLADDIVATWSTMQLPPPPALKPVTLDANRTALLLLDFSTDTCNQQQRPRCFDSLPMVAKLLAQARAQHVSVVYSTVPNGSTRNTPAMLAPQPGDPAVTSGADKFVNTELAEILKSKNISTVVVTGTIAQGAVLYTASAAALRGFDVVVPVDGMSASDPFGELATAWILANGPPSVTKHISLTRADMIHY